jgi:predicted anti-sigma-YlaC factor YlaD
MDCKRIISPLSDYLHGKARKRVCKEIEDHLDGCEKCRMHVDSSKLIITLYKRWRTDRIPKDTSIRLQKVVAEEARKQTARKQRARRKKKPSR